MDNPGESPKGMFLTVARAMDQPRVARTHDFRLVGARPRTMLVGEYRMIDVVQDDNLGKSPKSSCQQDDKAPDGRGRPGRSRGESF